MKTTSVVSNSSPNPNSNSAPSSSDTSHVAITDVGVPAGNPVSKTIGPTGGSVTSTDGVVQLTIPAGALSANTVITIQPITSKCPGGLGLGYNFLPNGTKFAQSASIKFQYGTLDSMNNPNLFFIAYQDTDRSWVADLGGADLDTVAKTVSLDINHFTPYQVFAGVYIYSALNDDEYKKGDRSLLNVEASWDPGYSNTVVNNNPIRLKQIMLPGSYIDRWGLRYEGPGWGTLTPNADNFFARFIAPPHIDPSILFNFPEADCRVDFNIVGKNGKVKRTIQSFTLYRKLRFVPDYSYDISVHATLLRASGFYSDIYVDSASFHVHIFPDWEYNADGSRDVKGFVVSLSNEVNSPPDDEPRHYENSSITADWIPDPYGLINITGATFTLADPTDKFVSMIFSQPNATLPGWNVIDKSTGINEGTPPAPSGVGLPAALLFTFADSSQFQSHNENPVLPYTVTITSN